MTVANKYDPDLTAKARTGTYIGKRNDQGTIAFRGIPYAQFNGRWKRVCELPASDNIVEAFTIGPACPQVSFRDWYPDAKTAVKDEATCFNLSLATSSFIGKKPVFVYIHGGANITGGLFDPRFDPQFFVDHNPDIVFVLLNYRLGVLGTLYLGGINDDPDYAYSGNLSLLDQLAAFKWIHENISAFGGDPETVTIAGQSSGSASMFKHMTIPESWNYWKRAICQSGTTFMSRPIPIEKSKQVTQQFMAALGADSLEAMLDLSVEDLLTIPPIENGITFTADGVTLPLDVNQAICSGDPAISPSGKDIMIGSMNGDMDIYSQDISDFETTWENAVNANLFILNGLTKAEAAIFADSYLTHIKDKETVKAFLKNMDRKQMSRLLQIYVDKYPDRDRFIAVSDCMNDYGMQYPLMLASSGLSVNNKVYHYMWCWHPKSTFPRRAVHAMDVAYVTNTQPNNEDLIRTIDEPETLNMYDVVQGLWGSFVRSGRPEYKAFKAQPYNPETKPFMIIDQEPYTTFDPRREEYENLEQLYRESTGRVD